MIIRFRRRRSARKPPAPPLSPAGRVCAHWDSNQAAAARSAMLRWNISRPRGLGERLRDYDRIVARLASSLNLSEPGQLIRRTSRRDKLYRMRSQFGMTTVEATAERWGVTVSLVRRYARQGRIEGVVKVGRDWLIPKSAKRPVLPTGRPRKEA